ncbi:MAG: glycosyltransferase family 2 protein [Weeksellaceae bacterium]
MKPLITILTPTYNRAELLTRAFESLNNQSIKNFEWLIIDDGSVDNTEEIITGFGETSFPIRYYKKVNGGKHTALNYGVHIAKGEFILMLDSDDYLINEAVEIITKKIDESRNINKLAGVAFRRINENGEIIGSSNFQSIITNSIDIRYKYKVTGDLVEIFKKEIMLAYPFPLIKNERFCPEVLIWNRISKNHNLKYFNQGIYVSEYLPGGLTDKIVKIRMQSPKASMLTYSELAKYRIPLKERIKANINFWRFSFNDKDWSFSKKLKMSIPWMTPMAYPLGFFMHLNDKSKVS